MNSFILYYRLYIRNTVLDYFVDRD